MLNNQWRSNVKKFYSFPEFSNIDTHSTNTKLKDNMWITILQVCVCNYPLIMPKNHVIKTCSKTKNILSHFQELKNFSVVFPK